MEKDNKLDIKSIVYENKGLCDLLEFIGFKRVKIVNNSKHDDYCYVYKDKLVLLKEDFDSVLTDNRLFHLITKDFIEEQSNEFYRYYIEGLELLNELSPGKSYKETITLINSPIQYKIYALIYAHAISCLDKQLKEE